MIFAQLQYKGFAVDRHDEIAGILHNRFPIVRDGVQGESWIWVFFDEDDKVQVDNFSSITTHEVKSPRAGAHVKAVIEVLQEKFRVDMLKVPLLEAHEDEQIN
jgi:hypothetical protein